jgi:isoquinoline 1-oxidoreductase beta subunit
VPSDVSRRRFLGYLIAAPMVVAAADLRAPARADAAIPTVQVVDGFDLTDVLTGAALPTAGLITVAVNPDGTASFALPRAEVGQGITTAIAMVIAEEMDLALDQVHMTLADARPELLFNQLTGGSNSVHSLYNQVRVAAAIAKGQLTAAAAKALATPAQGLKIKHGIIRAPDGRATNYGSLTKKAAARRSKAVVARLKSPSQFSLVGTPQRRIDAVAAVTGQKQFALDLDVPNALPTMVCRPPTINGTV